MEEEAEAAGSLPPESARLDAAAQRVVDAANQKAGSLEDWKTRAERAVSVIVNYSKSCICIEIISNFNTVSLPVIPLS